LLGIGCFCIATNQVDLDTAAGLKIGYVVIDVETGEREASLQVKRKLEEVPGTMRTRILY
jgi:hypothetical protein